MFCKNCGKEMSNNAVSCPQCGEPNLGGKSKVVATLLAFFLGGICIHRFYMGYVGMGIAYIVFCWTFIPAILALIDFIRILVGNLQPKNGVFTSN